MVESITLPLLAAALPAVGEAGFSGEEAGALNRSDELLGLSTSSISKLFFFDLCWLAVGFCELFLSPGVWAMAIRLMEMIIVRSSGFNLIEFDCPIFYAVNRP